MLILIIYIYIYIYIANTVTTPLTSSNDTGNNENKDNIKKPAILRNKVPRRNITADSCPPKTIGNNYATNFVISNNNNKSMANPSNVKHDESGKVKRKLLSENPNIISSPQKANNSHNNNSKDNNNNINNNNNNNNINNNNINKNINNTNSKQENNKQENNNLLSFLKAKNRVSNKNAKEEDVNMNTNMNININNNNNNNYNNNNNNNNNNVGAFYLKSPKLGKNNNNKINAKNNDKQEQNTMLNYNDNATTIEISTLLNIMDFRNGRMKGLEQKQQNANTRKPNNNMNNFVDNKATTAGTKSAFMIKSPLLKNANNINNNMVREAIMPEDKNQIKNKAPVSSKIVKKAVGNYK